MAKKNWSKTIKALMVMMFLFALPTIALATHQSSFNFHLQTFNLNGTETMAGVLMQLDVFDTDTCSGTPLFTDTCTTDVNGVCDITATYNMTFNDIDYACIYANSSLIDGSPTPFRAGYGQIDEDDVAFTDLVIANNLSVEGAIDVTGVANFYNDIYADADVIVTQDVTANAFFGDGSGLTNITADDLDIDDDEWLYLNTADTIGLRWNSTGNNIEMNQRLYVPNMISANSVDASLGYFDWLQIGFKGFSTGNPFTILNSTGTQKIVMNFDGNIIFADNDDNQYILWNTSTGGGGGIGLLDSGTYKSLELWSGWGVDDNIELYNPTNVWGNLTMISGNVTADYFFGDGSLLTNLPTQPQFWNRTGTTIFQANYGDDLTLQNGSIYLDKDYYIDWSNTTSYGRLTFNSTSNRFEFSDNLFVNGNVTASYFIGDGSQLTNLPSSPQYWNRTGTTLEPATAGDDIHSSGDLYLDSYKKLCLDGFTKSVCFFYNSSHGFIDGSNNALSLASVISGQYRIVDTSSGNYTDVIYNGTHIEFIDNTVVYGNVTADYFFGDGSQLTNLPQTDLTNVTTNIIPYNNNTQDLGNATNVWNNLYVNDLHCNSTERNVEYDAYFPITSGTTSNSLGLDATTQAIYNRFQQTIGGTASGTGYIRFELPPKFVSWNTTNTLCIDHRSNSYTTVSNSVTLYINGVADATVSGSTFSNTANNVWESTCFQPTSAVSPDDKINVHVTVSTAGNGQYGDLADVELYHLDGECD